MDKINNNTIIISYITQFFQYGIAIIVLPVILHVLDAKDIGIWYIFLSVTSLVSLLDFGFSASIQRTAAYVASGVSELKKSGVVVSNNTAINFSLLASLLNTSRNIYFRISLAILIIGSTLGALYIYHIMNGKFTLFYLITWLLYIVSVSANFHYNYLLSFLRGFGYINEYNVNVIISKSVYIIVLYMLVILGAGLISLVAATLANTILMIVLARYVLNKRIKGFSTLTKRYKCENLFDVLWKNAKNSGIVAVGVFLLSQSGVFLSGLFLSLEDVASLGLCIQLFGILVVCSRVYITTYTPKISSLWVKDAKEEIRSLFVKCQIMGYVVFLFGFFVILMAGDWVLVHFLHSNVLLPSAIVIIMYGLFNFMEITHGNCCSLIATSNQIPFTKASLISGGISIVLTIVFAKMELGMLSFPLALVCGSLPYNSWKWPYEVYKLIKPVNK